MIEMLRCPRRGSTFRSVAAALILGLAGCTTPGTLLERAWIEVRSDDLSIYTNLAEPEARRLIEDLQLFRATVALITKARLEDPRIPTEIYAFRSTGDFAPFRPRRDVAGFFLPGLRSNSMALMGTDRRVDARVIVYHEYTHFLLHSEDRLPYPPWFDEGFAELFSSVNVRDGMVRVGIVPEQRLNAFRYLELLPYARVIRAEELTRWSQDDLAMFYAQSWLIVHYLSLGRPKEEEGRFVKRLTRYLALLEQRIDEERAFTDAFGMDLSELKRRLEVYVKAIPSFGIPRERLALEFETSVRGVARDEIGTKLGWLALFGGNVDFAQRLFEQASTANPANSRALAGLGDAHKYQGRWDAAESAYRRSLELDPEDWENHLEFGEYLLHRAEQEEQGRDERVVHAREHFRKAIELAPANPEGHAMLGMTYLVGVQSPEPGIEALERAAVLLPSHPAIQFWLAQLHHRAGHRERAIEVLRRIVPWSHASEAAQQVTKLLEELESGASQPED